MKPNPTTGMETAALRSWARIGGVLLLLGLPMTGALAERDTDRLAIGDRVRAAVVRGLRVRDAPDGLHLGTQPPGAEGVITGGPRTAESTEFWWEISWERGVAGWSAESYLVRVAKSSPPAVALLETNAVPQSAPAPVPAPVELPEEWVQWRGELAKTLIGLRTQVGLLTSQSAQFEAGLTGLQTRQDALRVEHDQLALHSATNTRAADRAGLALASISLALVLWCL